MFNQAPSKNSTTVRSKLAKSKVKARPVSLHARFLERFPRLAGPLLSQLFLTPGRGSRRRLMRRTADPSDATRRGRVQVAGQRIDVFTRGRGPVVLLVHGWQSNRTRLGALAQAISDKGYTAVTWDMPAHGESRGRTTSLAQFVEAIFAVTNLVGPVHSIFGHSLGATAAALALDRGLSVQATVLIAPMISFDFALDQFQKLLRLSSPLRELTALHTESRVNLKRSEADLLRLSSPSCRVLLIHDEQDQRTPVVYSRKLADLWAPDELLVTDGFGHSRLLLEASVLERVANFVHETPRSEGSTRGTQL